MEWGSLIPPGEGPIAGVGSEERQKVKNQLVLKPIERIVIPLFVIPCQKQSFGPVLRGLADTIIISSVQRLIWQGRPNSYHQFVDEQNFTHHQV